MLSEKRIQGLVAFQDVRSAQEQPGRDGIGVRRSLQEIDRLGGIGFGGHAHQRSVRKIELNDIDGLRNIPSGA